MSQDSLTPSPTLEELKQQVADAKQQTEFDRLHEELRTLKEPNEFDGAMQEPDQYKVLKTKRRARHAVDILIDRLSRMFAVRPIIGNLIGIGLAFFAMYYIYHKIDLEGFKQYQDYFGIGTQLFAAVQIIKSGTRSLLLPVIALVFGSIAAHTLPHHHTLFGYSQNFYEHLMIVGVIGVGASILAID